MHTVVLLLALVPAGFTIVTIWRMVRRAPVAPPAVWPDVLLLRPIEAPTATERANLSLPIDYPGRVRHVVISPAPIDVAPGVSWVYSDPLCLNRKVGHLLYTLPLFDPDRAVVVAADGDVAVTGALLRSLVERLGDGVGVVSAAPVPDGGASGAAWLLRSVLGGTHQHFGALHAMSVGATVVSGKAMAYSAGALSELSRLQNVAGEDLELAKLLQARGLRCELADVGARCPEQQEVGYAAVYSRLRRWMQVVRAHRPRLSVWVPILFAPVPLFAVASLVTMRTDVAGATVMLALVRAVFSLFLARNTEVPSLVAAFHWFAGEGVLLVAWADALLRWKMVWRGRRYRIQPGGYLTAAHLGKTAT